MVTRVEGRGRMDWEFGNDQHTLTAMSKIDNQQEPSVQHRELCSVLCNNLNGKII